MGRSHLHFASTQGLEKKSDVLLLLNDEKSRGGGNFGRFLEVPLDSTAVD